jgi:hypothetical protein
MNTVKLSVNDWNSARLETNIINDSEDINLTESINLQLDSSLASILLGWAPVYSQQESIELTVKWWQRFLEKGTPAQEICNEDIKTWESRLKKYF